MRVEQYLLDCAVYIGIDDHDGARKLIGSGFCVKVDDALYIVTARHVIEDARFELRFIRMRTRTGYYDLPTQREAWHQSNDADVAAIRVNWGIAKEQGTLGTAVGLENFVDADYTYRGPPFDGQSGVRLAVGDSVFFLGLFVSHPGTDQLMPVARFGRISAMPAEPIELTAFGGTTTFNALAYLAECHSWGGHSGAPAFWYTPLLRMVRGSTGEDIPIMQDQYVAGIMGLVSAHFAIEQSATIGTSQSSSDIRTKLNAGMAAITPASAIRDLLMQDAVREAATGA